MFLKDILVITFTFLLLDAIYFTINSKFLRNTIQSVQHSTLKVNYIGVVLTYAIMVALEYYFIIAGNLKAIDAFFLGIGIYGIYELTNYATLRNWPLSLVIIDTLWGGILFASATCMVKYIIR